MIMRHDRVQEKHQALWMLTISPLVWATHFLASYLTAAIWCAKVAGIDGHLSPVRISIAIYTAVALLAISFVGWLGYRRHALDSTTAPHDEDTAESRHRFLGFATLLLSGLSFVAVVYSGMVALYFRSCI